MLPEVITDPVYGNCYELLLATFKHVPRMREIKAMAGPAMGNVAYLEYNGLPHVLVILEQDMGKMYIREWGVFDGVPQERYRWLSFSDPHIIGYLTIQ